MPFRFFVVFLLLIFMSHSYFSCRVRVDMRCILLLTLPYFFFSRHHRHALWTAFFLSFVPIVFLLLLVDSFSFEPGIVKLANDTISNRSSLESFPISHFIMFIIRFGSAASAAVLKIIFKAWENVRFQTWITSIIIQTLCTMQWMWQRPKYPKWLALWFGVQ